MSTFNPAWKWKKTSNVKNAEKTGHGSESCLLETQNSHWPNIKLDQKRKTNLQIKYIW